MLIGWTKVKIAIINCTNIIFPESKAEIRFSWIAIKEDRCNEFSRYYPGVKQILGRTGMCNSTTI
jgi:hypothetical protein